MKWFANLMVELGFIWVGFWLALVDMKMQQQLQNALEDGLSKYPV